MRTLSFENEDLDADVKAPNASVRDEREPDSSPACSQRSRLTCDRNNETSVCRRNEDEARRTDNALERRAVG